MWLFKVLIACCHSLIVLSVPVLIETTPYSLETLDEVTAVQNNKTTEKSVLEERQTEAIKRVIAEHQDIPLEYPVLTKYEPQLEMDKISLEELKIKCQLLSRLLGINNKTSQTIPTRPANHKYPDIQARPVYYPTRPTFRPIKYPQTSKPQGFYITSQPSTTRRPPSTTNEQPTTPIKYIRLEPVILQKTILGDGRTVYLWHKSLPTAVEYPTNYYNQIQSESHTGYDYNNANKLGYSPQYGYYYDSKQQLYGNNYVRPTQNVQVSENAQQVTTESTTTTTTEDSNSYGYGFSNFIPFYSYRQQETSSSSTTEPSTTIASSTTTMKPPTETAPTSDILYAQQLKFVVPVPVDDEKGTIPIREPWNFDPYVYYPKPLQPSSINVQVPYNPMFHVIKAVKVPGLENKENVNVD